MTLFLGEALIEANVRWRRFGACGPRPAIAVPAVAAGYMGVERESWLADVTAVVFNSAFWVLWVGVFALLFFWRREPVRPGASPQAE